MGGLGHFIFVISLYCIGQVQGVTEFFSWTHAAHYDSNIKQYVLDNFNTDQTAAFGWKLHTDTDSLKLVHDPHGSGYVLQVFYQSGTRTNYDTHGHSCPSSSTGPCHRGAQFYVMPPSLYHKGKTFAALEYEVFFKSGFNFAIGGKLPGLWGGTRDSCKGCSGEAHSCFSTRLMWRADGHYEVYAYIPYNQDGGFKHWCDRYEHDHKKVICPATTCGTEIGLTSTDAFKFKPGQWYRIRQEVNLGHPNQHGRVTLWVNDIMVVNMNRIVLRQSSSVHIDGMFFSTFYGGKSTDFGKHGDTYSYFKNFRITDEKKPVHSGEYFVGK
ncbi:unnamed protein product [Mytilus edulis]|uniref:Polysaccharide lyase 14 domain-containing protein n=2 Tax=Mytilus TaxID=6548 RepID=A0A8B6H4C6_MYTGA|nr:unnamed protein product [Mytilus edulis]VDI73175.1 Hypothetical predicted protein [Mytilus galloprovincialis]